MLLLTTTAYHVTLSRYALQLECSANYVCSCASQQQAAPRALTQSPPVHTGTDAVPSSPLQSPPVHIMPLTLVNTYSRSVQQQVSAFFSGNGTVPLFTSILTITCTYSSSQHMLASCRVTKPSSTKKADHTWLVATEKNNAPHHLQHFKAYIAGHRPALLSDRVLSYTTVLWPTTTRSRVAMPTCTLLPTYEPLSQSTQSALCRASSW